MFLNQRTFSLKISDKRAFVLPNSLGPGVTARNELGNNVPFFPVTAVLSTKSKLSTDRDNIMSRVNESSRGGSGIVNTLINKLPLELHPPAGLIQKYNQCGSRVWILQRLSRGTGE